jgi:multiple sugar transport system permease protein/sn-glycerol 3-phosphate transport system permease protein
MLNQKVESSRTQSSAVDYTGLGKSGLRVVEVIVTYAILITGAIALMVPFLWMLTTSLKTEAEVMTWPIQWIPDQLIWQNYVEVFQRVPFARYMGNSFFLAFMTILGQLIGSTLAGFGFARMRFPGREVLFFVMLSTMMLPAWVVVVPHFMMFNAIDWLDTYKPIIVPAFFGSPFYIFLCRQAFLGISPELEDAARIDGASTFRIFMQIFLPLTKPTLATIAIFAFYASWNSLLYPLVYLRTQLKFPVSLGMRMFQTADPGVLHYPRMMAAAVIALLPALLIFSFAQRLFIQGTVMTGVEK